MRRIKLTVAYDGTNYAGWQRQPVLPTIQGHIEENLSRIVKHPVTLYGSGRTDSGVHAVGQVAHFVTYAHMPADKFVYALNAGLPRDIRIIESEEVDEQFHARFTSKNKHYRYTIRNAAVADALQGRYQLHLHAPLDVPLMQSAASMVKGEHDFAAFAGSGSKITKTVRTVYRSEISQEGSLIYYDVVGNGFLYRMVRMLIGSLIDIGYNRITTDDFMQCISGKKTISSGQTAPPHGLMLMKVTY